MNLTEILRVSFHLSGLYDKQREPGTDSPWSISFDSKKKKELAFPTNNAGWQITLLGEILEALNEYERDYPGGSPEVKFIYRKVRRKISLSISENDVVSILKTVSTTDIRICDFQNNEIAQQTALVIYSGQTNTVQLTPLGRSLIRLEETKEDWLSADLDAEKIVKNIELGRFDVALKYCRSLGIIIQDEKFNIQTLLEQPYLEKKRKEYFKIREHYLDTISKIQKAFIRTLNLLDSKDIQKSIADWIHQDDGDVFIEKKINTALDRLRKSLTILNELFNKLIEELLNDHSEKIVQIPNFTTALKNFVDQGMPLSLIDTLFSLYGKGKMYVPLGATQDVIVPLVPKAEAKERSPETGLLKDKSQGVVVKRLIDRYREKYKKEFQGLLEKEKPFKLSDILKAHEFGTDEVINIYHFLSTSLNIVTINIGDFILYTSLGDSLSVYDFPDSNQKIWISDLTFTPRKINKKEPI